MLSIWIIMCFLMVMSLAKRLGASLGSNNSQCSCYTFDGTPKNWWYGKQQCRHEGGDLVSMETVEEWEFIKTQIQSRITGNFDEWWIGLEKRDGRWTWMSNHTLTYDKWQPREPNFRQYEKCVVMAKNYPANTYGLLSDAGCGMWKGRICENIKKAGKGCSNNQVRWCRSNPVTPKMTASKTNPEATETLVNASTTSAAAITTTVTTSGQKIVTIDSTTPRKYTSDNKLNVSSPQTTTKINNDSAVAGEYPIPTTASSPEHTEMSTTLETDDGKATGVSLTEKPFPTLTIIIVVLVVGVVVFLCCVVLCVHAWKRKRKGKLKTALKNHDTNTDHNTSDFIAGSSSGVQLNHLEMRAIVIHSNNACAQEDSHETTHGNVLNNSHAAKEVTMSSDGYLVPQEMILNVEHLEVRNYSNVTSFEATVKNSNQNKAKTEISNPSGKFLQEHMDLQAPASDKVGEENIKESDIYATVDKSKKNKKTTEVVYAQINENPLKSGPQEHVDLQVPIETVNKKNTKVSAIYATVDKSKKRKAKEVVYAQVNKSSKKPANQDLATYAELPDFYHDATRSISNGPPPYHPTEYASVSTK